MSTVIYFCDKRQFKLVNGEFLKIFISMGCPERGGKVRFLLIFFKVPSIIFYLSAEFCGAGFHLPGGGTSN